MNDWSKDINLETIKEYLQECTENDDYHYEQYQIDIVMHEYIRQKQIIERLNNIINELEKELDRGYRDLFAHELVPGRELITNIKNYLEELKKGGKK